MNYCVNLSIFTDDDAELIYNNESYCFYNDDLIINRLCDTLDECFKVLDEITITPGQKASELINSIFDEIKKDRKTSYSFHGNQDIEWKISTIKKEEFLNKITSDVPLSLKMLKLMEEVGEASQALLKIEDKNMASKSASDFLEELVDVQLVLDDIIDRIDPKRQEFEELKLKKIDKWFSKYSSEFKTKKICS